MEKEFTEQDLRAVLHRAMRSVGIGTLIGLPLIWKAWGWQSLLLFLLGAAISWTGIVEWRQLMSAIMRRLEAKGRQRPVGRVILWFFLRLVIAGVLLYVSLKMLHGKVLALVVGLALSVLALLIEALRLFRSWSA